MNDREWVIWRRLAALHSGELSTEDFEQWVYSDPGLEAALGPDLALEFLALDYRKPAARQELHSLVERAYAERRPGEFPYDLARRVAEELLAGERDLWQLARILAENAAYFAGNEEDVREYLESILEMLDARGGG